MSYKVGDKVLIEGEVVEIDNSQMVNTRIAFKDDTSEWFSEKLLFDASKTYSDGLADAWELARKICGDGNDEKNYDGKTVSEIFGGYLHTGDIMDDFTYQEALAKIEAYEESKVFKVGDVVYECDKEDYGYGVVTDLCDDECCILWDEGYCCKCEIENLVKTGRHIDISNLLEQIRGNE